ncbi:MAG: carboxyl transferase domain-containing protein [Actinomycetota bacterium]
MKAVAHLVDPGSFEPVSDGLTTVDPLGFPGYLDAMARARARSEADESVAAGPARIGGIEVELAAFDFTFFGGSVGEVAGERVARALERATERRVPFVLRLATGGSRMQEGMRSLVQMARAVAARIGFEAAAQPFVVVLADPTTGGPFASIGSLADVTIAEEKARIGFAGPRLVEAFTGRRLAGSHSAETALAAGLLDAVVPSVEVGRTVAHVLEVLAPDRPSSVSRPPVGAMEEPSGWETVRSARSDARPTGPGLLRDALDAHVLLQGDRAGREDPAVAVALGRLAGRRLLMVGLDRSMAPGPAAYRKVRRTLEIARRLRLPVVTLIDTPGANPSEVSENAGIASEIAQLLRAKLRAEVPVLGVVIGEGGSGGALAFAVGDRLVAYAGSIFSVIAPESAAEILWRDATRADEAANLLKIGAFDLVRLGIADEVVAEPLTPASLATVVAYHLESLCSNWRAGDDPAPARIKRWRNHGG